MLRLVTSSEPNLCSHDGRDHPSLLGLVIGHTIERVLGVGVGGQDVKLAKKDTGLRLLRHVKVRIGGPRNRCAILQGPGALRRVSVWRGRTTCSPCKRGAGGGRSFGRPDYTMTR